MSALICFCIKRKLRKYRLDYCKQGVQINLIITEIIKSIYLHLTDLLEVLYLFDSVKHVSGKKITTKLRNVKIVFPSQSTISSDQDIVLLVLTKRLYSGTDQDCIFGIDQDSISFLIKQECIYLL